MIYYIDPPKGWRYGFPKLININEERDNQWWLDNGYPQHLIDQGMLEHVRIISYPDSAEEKSELENL